MSVAARAELLSPIAFPIMRRMTARRTSSPGLPRPPLPRYVVIMAGGQSTRFWPLSRRRRPKQFLSIRNHRSLLQETAQRLLPLCTWRRLLVVTNAEYVDEVRRQLPRLAARQILAEPDGRNTAACLALAAEWIATRGGDALMVVAPADHLIDDAPALRRTLQDACDVAVRHDALVTIGVRPTAPETGYGYVEVGERLGRVPAGSFRVKRFHEKPSAARARRYVGGGRHLWNSGMFVWKASVFRAALEQSLPELRRGLDGVWRGSNPAARLRRIYRRLPAVSVDAGVLQPISRRRGARAPLAVIRARFGWLDVGSWAAMPAVWGHDARGNAARGRVLAIAARANVVYAPDRLVALVGVRDLIVVETADALLICRRDDAQAVRHVATELRRRGLSRYL